jgi:hypothetical protein
MSAAVFDLFVYTRADFERGVCVFEHTGLAAELLIAQYFSPVSADLRPIQWVAP